MCHPDQAPLDDSVLALRFSHAMQINKPKWDAWKMLPEAVKTGAVPFALAHGGLDMHQVPV